MTKAAEKPVPRHENPLNRLTVLLADDMRAVDGAITSKMQSDVPLIPELAGHLISSGGKRIRPLLTIACAQLCGYKGSRAAMLAACVEFIHTATLLHDDVVDESDTRRGNQSANTVFGNEAAVLVGDFLFSRAFQLMVADGSLDVLRILSNASAVIAEGEVMQLTTAHNLDTNFQQYIQVITAKTAALFAAACEVGAVLANESAERQKALHHYGLYLGIAFQIADDVLDYTAAADQLGKTLGDDLRDGKMTLPVIYALEKATPEEKSFWTNILLHEAFDDSSLNRAIEICNKHNSFTRALDTAHKYKEMAVETLSHFGDHKIKNILADTAEYVIQRSM